MRKPDLRLVKVRTEAEREQVRREKMTTAKAVSRQRREALCTLCGSPTILEHAYIGGKGYVVVESCPMCWGLGVEEANRVRALCGWPLIEEPRKAA